MTGTPNELIFRRTLKSLSVLRNVRHTTAKATMKTGPSQLHLFWTKNSMTSLGFLVQSLIYYLIYPTNSCIDTFVREGSNNNNNNNNTNNSLTADDNYDDPSLPHNQPLVFNFLPSNTTTTISPPESINNNAALHNNIYCFSPATSVCTQMTVCFQGPRLINILCHPRHLLITTYYSWQENTKVVTTAIHRIQRSEQ